MDLVSLIVAQAPVGEAGRALEVQSIWDFIMKGGVMMIPIGLCSVIALTVVLERLLSLRRSKVMPASFLPGLKRVLLESPGDKKSAIEYCRQDASPVANVFAAGIKKLDGSIESVEKYIQEAGEREALKLRKFVRVLSVIASVAPLLGLLGTIFGMITAFQTVAISGEALGKTELLAGGIYEAMITTAGGLLVAIPVLICFHWISAKVDRLVMEIDYVTVQFVEEFVEGGLDGAGGREPATPDGEADEALAPSAVGLGNAPRRERAGVRET